jgi:phage gp37-like protein
MDFEQVEDRIIEKLRDEVSYLRTVETYAGQLEEEIAKLPVLFPSAYVVYGGSTINRVDGPTHQETVEFSVLVAAKNMRGGEALRKGSPATGGQGVYGMVKDVLKALTNEDFGLDMERLRPLRVSPVFVGKTMAIYGIDFQSSFDGAYEW